MEEIKNDLNEIKSVVKDIRAYLKQLVGIERDVLKALYPDIVHENILLKIFQILEDKLKQERGKQKWQAAVL